MTVHVMHLVPGLGLHGRTGGMEHNVIKLCNALATRDVRSSICALRQTDPGVTALLQGHTSVFTCARGEGTSVRVIGQLTKLLRRERPQIVHTHGWGTLVEGYLAARLAGVPGLVHGEHGTMQTKLHQRLAQRVVWARADQVLSVSSLLADRMSSQVGFPRAKIGVIRNGVNLARFAHADRPHARQELGLPASWTVAGTVGRMVAVKDHATFIRSIALARQAGHDLHGAIVGDGPLRSETEAIIGALGLQSAVHLVGYRADVNVAMAALDVFVLPSLSEGLSNTILEAMAAGLAIVATDVGGARELLEPGCSGLLVPPSDAPAMAAALGEVVASDALRRRLGASARQRATELFDDEAMFSRYHGLYLSLARSADHAVGPQPHRFRRGAQ